LSLPSSSSSPVLLPSSSPPAAAAPSHCPVTLVSALFDIGFGQQSNFKHGMEFTRGWDACVSHP
jgi:hypothetical protein